MRRLLKRLAAILLAMPLMLSACQSMPANQAATIDLSDPVTRAAVTSALADAVGRARVELGPASRETSVVTVLPPPPGPLETNSMAMPVRFDIEKRGGVCFAVRSDTGKAYELPGVTCKPA